MPNLYPILIGPPGIGKTTLCRYYAQSRAKITGNDSFELITFDESTKPAHLINDHIEGQSVLISDVELSKIIENFKYLNLNAPKVVEKAG